MAKRKPKRSRRQRSGLVEIVNALLTLLILGMLVVGGLVLYGAHGFYAAGPTSKDTTFVVDKGANIGTVAGKLQSLGLIRNRYIFQLGGWVLKEQSGIKAGEFAVPAGASMAEILNEIRTGKPILYAITIPEGFSIAQVVDRLRADTDLTGNINDLPPEGSVLPQTYNYDPGVTRQSVLDKMVAAEKATLARIWAGRDPDLPLTSPEQLVTLASIVEKETGVPGERAQVAAVFVNRLKKHMRLQSDPTIIYGITKGAGPLGRGLRRSEIEAQTPYNTYQIDGLPPGPIANPGEQSLTAAAHPAKTDDLYFVAASANPRDGHLFSSSYAEHRKNVAKFRAAVSQQASDDADAAKDALVQSQAAAAGDSATGDAGTSDSAAPPDTIGSGGVASPDTSTPGATAPAGTAPASGTNAPVPAPVSQRPHPLLPPNEAGAQDGNTTGSGG